MATITVNRTYTPFGASTADAASVNYATSDATAFAGTNYTPESGTLSFAAGQLTATFTVPVTDLNPQGGNKLLNLTLSNPLATGANTIASLGQSTATLTIVDTHANGTPTDITAFSPQNHNAFVKSTGPTSSGFLDVLGSSNGAGSEAFGVTDFNDAIGASFTDGGLNGAVTAINSITLGLTNSPFGSSASGVLDVYLMGDNSRSLTDSSLTYDTSVANEGLSNQLGTKIAAWADPNYLQPF